MLVEEGLSMEAKATNLMKFLGKPIQFVIPIYQRKYSWDIKQCQQLWNDIVKVASEDSTDGHFMGSIVYVEKGLYNITSVPQVLVIDGQQRLTTISLVLTALAKAIDGKGAKEISKKKIENYYLFNNEEEGDLKYKLLLTQTNRETLKCLVEGHDLSTVDPSEKVLENYTFFENKILTSNLDVDTIFKGLSKLIIVDIALDRERDNPQLIFESLNSTGLDLTQADLIRNFVLMGLEAKEQDELYRKYWHPMECGFGQERYAENFDYFMRDFLTIKIGRIPNLGEIYREFKDYIFRMQNILIRDVVMDIHHYADLYCKLAFCRYEDKEILEGIQRVAELKYNVVYPFLVVVLDDYQNNIISKPDLIEILHLVESYILRRSICGIPTNSLNKTFANLRKEVRPESYLESVKAAFMMMDSYRRFPKDEEFRLALETKDLYHTRLISYVLDRLENHNRKEKVIISNFTIEHIMPQKDQLTPEWQIDLGANWKRVHDTYLHTLGNLTLTGYNSELGYSSFTRKQTMEGGFKDSPIRMNRYLASVARWDEEGIKARASHLSEMASDIWSYPTLSEDILNKYREKEDSESKKTYTLETHKPNLYGSGLEIFNILRARILSLDPRIREEIKKVYIAYKFDTNFVDLVPWKGTLEVTLNMPFSELVDSQKKARNTPRGTHWGNGDISIALTSVKDIDYVMTLIKQALDWQMNGD